MRRLHTIIIISLSIWICSCSVVQNPSARIALFNTSTGLPVSEEDSTLGPTSFIEFRPDYSYTSDLGRFQYGHWSVKGQQLYLTNQYHKTYAYWRKIVNFKVLRLVMAKGEVAHFDGHPLPSGDLQDDPFSTHNNEWRIPAICKEDDAAIRQRLFNHCRFWEILFTWGQDNSVKKLDVSNMPTPFKIYQNGFGLKRFVDLPAEWKSYFFDENDCHRADSLIKYTFRHTKIVWPDTEDDYKRFVSGFQQLEKALR